MKAAIFASGVLFFSAAGLAQNGQPIRIQRDEVYAYQHSGIVGAPGSEPVLAGMIGPDGRMGLLNVTGKPFSGTEVRHSVQTLPGGAKIENSDSNQIYRDDQGRTRVEQTVDGRTTVVIMDPVAHFVAVLDRAGKTAHKTPIPADAVNGDVSVSGGKIMVRMGTTTTSRTTVEGHGAPPPPPPMSMDIRVDRKDVEKSKVSTEDLGEKPVNGVMAKGTKEIRTIPAGAIGNDRDLQVVDERWFSNDLQMLIKSVNTDPRFGETSYQLTNIVRTTQDPALFQLPADYAVSEFKPGK